MNVSLTPSGTNLYFIFSTLCNRPTEVVLQKENRYLLPTKVLKVTTSITFFKVKRIKYIYNYPMINKKIICLVDHYLTIYCVLGINNEGKNPKIGRLTVKGKKCTFSM